MLTETTITKLREMRLSVMASALKDQLADPQFQNMAFEDRLSNHDFLQRFLPFCLFERMK